MTGSDRIFNHDVFSELSWKRDPFLSWLYVAPVGFQNMAGRLGAQLMGIIEDINALQVMRDSTDWSMDTFSLVHIDNQQAWIESRLYWCRKTAGGNDEPVDCCVLAAYLCTYVLYADTWRNSMIPSHCSAQLLEILQRSAEAPADVWDGNDELLLWVLMIGGAFIPRGPITNEYYRILLEGFRGRLKPLTQSWEQVESTLCRFVWSDKIFKERCRAFWEDRPPFSGISQIGNTSLPKRD